MSRKKKIIIAVVTAAVFVLALTIAAFCIFKPQPDADNGNKKEPIKNATTEVNKLDDGTVEFEVEEGTVTYSHGCILESVRYPGWKVQQISLKTDEISDMTQDEDKMFITGDDTEKEAFLASDTSSHTAENYDLIYVYTMPCKARVDIVLNAKVNSSGGDGVVVYAYRNDISNCIINGTIVTNSAALQANDIILEKGDKIYFRYNKNESVKNDAGIFYAKLTYKELVPEGDAFRGEAYKLSEQEVNIPSPGTSSYSHGSIKYADTYPFWSAVAISLTDEKETAMVREDGRLYIEGDTSKSAYFDSKPAANTSGDYDLAYVYTMPCRAKLNVVLTAGVTATGGDGIVGYVYVNSISNMLIDKTVFQPGADVKAVPANNVILEKGDKIYFRYNKNQSTEKDEGIFYGKITWVEIDPRDDGSGGNADNSGTAVNVTAGTVSFSHGMITNSATYPCWEVKSVDLSTNEISDMVKDSETKSMYVAKDTAAYVNSGGKAQSSKEHDLLYVYTMPCRAKVDIELHASVAGGNSDGVAVYAYRNSTDHCMINHTKVTNTANKAVGTAKGVIFEKGDKLYFRLNSNGTTTDDAGYFYAKLTYVEIDAKGDAFVGEAYKVPSQGGDNAGDGNDGEDDVPTVEVAAGTTTYAHDHINYPDMHPGWAAVSISFTDGTETAMVKEDGNLYMAGDIGKEAYFASNGMAKTSEESDLAYVYTMPCKAKVNIELMTMLTGASDDGIVVSVYADEVSNSIIRNTAVTKDDSLKLLTADNIILEKGTKLYFRLNKNSSASKDEGLFHAKITFAEINPKGDGYKKVTWKDMVSGGVMSGGAYGTYYSHGSISNPILYPYWETRSISLTDGKEAAMIKGSIANTMYVSEDKSAYLNVSGKSQTSDDNDLLYIFTMPCKAKINIFLNASVSGEDSDGVVVYAYANNTSNCIINRTVVTNTSNKTVAAAKGITLDEGDKIYFRLNKNETITDDYGYFYAKITYVDEEPDEDVFRGEELEEGVTWKDLVEGIGTNKGKTYSHGSIAYPGTYAYWETISIDLSTGEEKPLVTGRSVNHRYVDGDVTAYLNSSGKMQSAANHDLVYVFTMPCKAKVNIALNASVTSGSDGVKVSCYLNDTSNYLIDEKTVTRTSNAPAGSVNGITLKAGDRIYFRVNKNGTIENDNGMFYGAITFLNEAP